MCHFAVDMMEALCEYNAQQLLRQVSGTREDNGEVIHFDMRIGINSGPVVAGVIGTSRFLYGIWYVLKRRTCWENRHFTALFAQSIVFQPITGEMR